MYAYPADTLTGIKIRIIFSSSIMHVHWTCIPIIVFFIHNVRCNTYSNRVQLDLFILQCNKFQSGISINAQRTITNRLGYKTVPVGKAVELEPS